MTDSISARLRAVTEDNAYAHPFTFAVTCREAADHIDAQDAKIAALVEALEWYAEMMAIPTSAAMMSLDADDGYRARAALAAAKETT